MTAPLTWSAPCAPPVTYTTGSPGASPAQPSAAVASPAFPVSTSARTGLPVTTAAARACGGSRARVDSADTAMTVARPARTRLARPSRVVCSWTTRGTPHQAAASPTGIATYPPVASTASGLNSRTAPRAWRTPTGTRAMSRALAGVSMSSGLPGPAQLAGGDGPERDQLIPRHALFQASRRPGPDDHQLPARRRQAGPQRAHRGQGRVGVAAAPAASHDQAECTAGPGAVPALCHPDPPSAPTPALLVTMPARARASPRRVAARDMRAPAVPGTARAASGRRLSSPHGRAQPQQPPCAETKAPSVLQAAPCVKARRLADHRRATARTGGKATPGTPQIHERSKKGQRQVYRTPVTAG